MSASLESVSAKPPLPLYPQQVRLGVDSLYRSCNQQPPPLVLARNVVEYNEILSTLTSQRGAVPVVFLACAVLAFTGTVCASWMLFPHSPDRGIDFCGCIVLGLVAILATLLTAAFLEDIVPEYDRLGIARILASEVVAPGVAPRPWWRLLNTRVDNSSPRVLVQCLYSAMRESRHLVKSRESWVARNSRQPGVARNFLDELKQGFRLLGQNIAEADPDFAGLASMPILGDVSPGVLTFGQKARAPSPLQAYVELQQYLDSVGLQDDATLDRMPMTIQAAYVLWALADEVALFDGAVVVLARGGREGNADYSSPSMVGTYDLGLLSPAQRAQCRRALGWRGRNVRALLALAMGWDDLRAACVVYQAVGMDTVIETLGLAPRQQDRCGVLYAVGRGTQFAGYVRVQDCVLGDDGQPLVHWLAVPQHVSSAHEGIAWSYSISAVDYAPTAEA